MKRTSKIFAALTFIAMLLSACGGGGGSEGAAGDSSGGDQPDEIVYGFPVFGNIPGDMQLIEDEVNKISIPEINVKVKMLPISAGSWQQQVNLMISGGEKLDLMPTLDTYFSPMVAQKQLLDVTDLLEQHGQGIKSAIGENLLKGTTVDGKVYGVTVGNGKASVPNIAMRKDILDKYGLSIDDVNSLEDIQKIYETVAKNEPQMSMLVPASKGNPILIPTSILMHSEYDGLGDGFGVLMGNNNYKVVNLYETEEYKSLLRTMRDWYQKGYVLKDAATTNETSVNLFKAGKGFSQFVNGEVGQDTQLTRNTGFPFVTKKLQEPLITSSVVQGLTWVVPITSKNPEAAMKFLNLTYTNSDVINLIDWGIEGKHYVKNEDGTIGYPDGVDSNNTGYGLGQDWLMGNQLIAHVWEGNDPANYKILEENNKNAPVSIALGFSYDSTKVKTEIANVTNASEQYRAALESGTIDPDKNLPEFLSRLKAAGIDKIIAEKQKQLDAWVAANGGN